MVPRVSNTVMMAAGLSFLSHSYLHLLCNKQTKQTNKPTKYQECIETLIMPTQSLTLALLVLTAGTKGLPWKLSAWKALMNIHGVPWDTEETVSDDSHSEINPE